MSSPAASCSAMMLATASRYCSRNRLSPSADLNARPSRLRSNQSGRGYEPVMVVGKIMSRVTVSTAGLQLMSGGSPHEQERHAGGGLRWLLAIIVSPVPVIGPRLEDFFDLVVVRIPRLYGVGI